MQNAITSRNYYNHSAILFKGDSGANIEVLVKQNNEIGEMCNLGKEDFANKRTLLSKTIGEMGDVLNLTLKDNSQDAKSGLKDLYSSTKTTMDNLFIKTSKTVTELKNTLTDEAITEIQKLSEEFRTKIRVPLTNHFLKGSLFKLF